MGATALTIGFFIELKNEVFSASAFPAQCSWPLDDRKA